MPLVDEAEVVEPDATATKMLITAAGGTMGKKKPSLCGFRDAYEYQKAP